MFARSLSFVSGGSSGCGGPAESHPRRNISGFVDLAPLGATAPAGKGCVSVDPPHASLYVSFSCHFQLWFSSTFAGQGSWALPTTVLVRRQSQGGRQGDGRAMRAASLFHSAARRHCPKLLLLSLYGRVTAGRTLFARQHYVSWLFGRQTSLGYKGSSFLAYVHRNQAWSMLFWRAVFA